MGTGAITILPDCAAARQIGGPDSLYYCDLGSAVAALDTISGWDTLQYRLQSSRLSDWAYAKYADGNVLPRLLETWRQLKKSNPTRQRDGLE